MQRKNSQFAVLGLGRFGTSIVRTLCKNGCNVLACDEDEDIVQEISEIATHAVQVNVTDEAAMHSLGLGNFDVVIIAIGDDMEASLIATLVAKEMGAKFVLVKAQNSHHKVILEKIGADRVVLPEFEMGERLATSLITTNVIDYINLSEEFSIAEIEPLEQWIDVSIQKANIRATIGLNIVAIKRGKRVIVSPKADELIQDEDILVVIGETSVLQRLHTKNKVKSGGLF